MRSLRARIALAFAALIVTAMAAISLIVLRAEERRYREALDERLLAEARLVGEAAAPLLGTGATIETLDGLAKRLGAEAGGRVTVIAPDGGVLGDSENDPRALDNHRNRPEVLAALAAGSGLAGRHSGTEGRDFRYAAVAVRDGDRLLGIARVATPVSAVNADLRRNAAPVVFATAGAAVAAIIVAALIARAVTGPLAQLVGAARALAAGAFDQRVTVQGSAEVSELAGAFNDMARRLRDTVHTLAEQRNRLEALLASSIDALVALDHDRVVRYLNPAAAAIFGDAEGRSFPAVARHHELSAVVNASLKEGRPASAPVHLDEPDRWVQVTCTPIRDGGGWAALVNLHDITEVRHAETARRDFVANVSHELRTPLAGIKAVVETLRDGAIEDPAAAAEFLGRVDAEVDRLVQLVEELLQLARIEAGTALVPRQVAPAAVLAAAVKRFTPLAERAAVALALDVPAELPEIQADPARLGQAVGNLIHNAIKFTPAGGAVTVGAAASRRSLRITVRDTGAGIDPADLPRIFERFYIADRARSGGGTGLGLAIVKHVARAHSGTVTAESRLGRGSSFTIKLPLPRG